MDPDPISALEESNAKSIDEAKESLVEKVDGYLSYVVEQWISENEIALESGMKSEILDGFINGMKNLFAEHYVDVPEERFDLLGDAQEKVEELEKKLNEQLEANVELNKSVKEMEKAEVLSKASDGMAETDKEKFVGLTEDLSFEDKESFEKKVNTFTIGICHLATSLYHAFKIHSWFCNRDTKISCMIDILKNLSTF